MMERTGISNRDACRIVNTCLTDLKMNKAQFILEQKQSCEEPSAETDRFKVYWI